MKLTEYKPGIVGLGTAFAASLCCALPLAIVLLGLGSGAFMIYTMHLRWILYPVGIIGLVTAWWLFRREKRRCDALACQMAGRRTNLVLVIAASGLMVVVTYVDFFMVQL